MFDDAVDTGGGGGMNDYQAIYDAVRSRISGVNVDDAVYRALSDTNISFYFDRVSNLAMDVVYEYGRPSTVYKPTLSVDGNQWCALFGVNLMEGVAGFGDSPAEAYADFDKNWNEKLPERRPTNDHP